MHRPGSTTARARAGPTTVLDRIVVDVRVRLGRRMAEVGLAELRARARGTADRDPGAVIAALRGDTGVRVIVEVKRVSPAAGPLAAVADPGALAESYALGGAAAISVLTEPDHFGGSLGDLVDVRSRVPVPVLCKDVVVDGYQVVEAAAHGADLVLLIAAALPQVALVSLLEEARRWGLVPLVETHTADEVARAADAGAEVIGVNNRDLATLEVDRGAFGRLAAAIPRRCGPGRGVRRARAGRRPSVRGGGADAVLVGSVLVATTTPLPRSPRWWR
nr:indole-3-glycerol phosphate synthase [uncultured bacterium]